MPAAAAAAAIVEARAAEMVAHAENVLDVEHIEGVHDMRVATRRLRAALETFQVCFPKKHYRRALRDVKELADALGERRDRDVSIAALEEFASALAAPDRLGVASLVEALRAEQADANSELAAFVAGERVAALQAQIGELVSSAAGVGDTKRKVAAS